MTAAVRRRLASASAESGWRACGAFGRAWLHALHTRARRACVYLARPVSVESVESLMNFGETAESNINSRGARAGGPPPAAARRPGFARSAAWSASSVAACTVVNIMYRRR